MELKKWRKNSSGVGPAISVVIASYNNPRALELCLEGYLRQSCLQGEGLFELIVADDGSKDEIEKLCLKFAGEIPFPFTFLQKPHSGWGKPRMLNWSVLESKTDWIVFTDGDCVPHRRFVQGHLESRVDGQVNCGRRVDVMEKLGPRITVADVRKGTLDCPFWLFWHLLIDDFDFGTQGLYLPKILTKAISAFSKNRMPTIVGSNFSMQKKRLEDLNGFDESFLTPGMGEDTDLERRIRQAGLKLEWVTYRAIQFHLWHPLTVVGQETQKVFEELKAKANPAAGKGLKELMQEKEFRKILST